MQGPSGGDSEYLVATPPKFTGKSVLDQFRRAEFRQELGWPALCCFAAKLSNTRREHARPRILYPIGLLEAYASNNPHQATCTPPLYVAPTVRLTAPRSWVWPGVGAPGGAPHPNGLRRGLTAAPI